MHQSGESNETVIRYIEDMEENINLPHSGGERIHSNAVPTGQSPRETTLTDQEDEPFWPDFPSLLDFATSQQIMNWYKEYRQMMVLGYSEEAIESWFYSLRRIHGPQMVGYSKCSLESNLVIASNEQLPMSGTVGGSGMNCMDSACPK